MIMNILFVDDEPLILQDILRSIDWKALGIDDVHSACSAKEAMQLFTRHHFDIVACDIEMPQTNGITLLYWIKEQSPATQCIIISCHSVFSYAQDALRLGCVDYMLKPVLPEALEKILTKTIRDLRTGHFEEETKTASSLISMAVKVIAENLHTDISRKEVAQEVFMNPDYLDRRFKAETGLSVAQYITQKKIDKAKHYLRNTSMTISEIAYSLGYGSLSSFSSIFKQITSQSPQFYRKKV
jgi:two-component system, response regulator YesN